MQKDLKTTNEQVLSSLYLITETELARAHRFRGANQKFRNWCQKCGIEPVPGRSNYYDPKAVRHRLDALQGLLPAGKNDETVSLVEQRRARRAA